MEIGAGPYLDAVQLESRCRQDKQQMQVEEMLNRIDDVVVFRPLSREGLGRIAGIQIEQLRRMVAERQLSIEVDAAAIDKLVELGYDPALGARPLKRVIARLIQDPLAEAMLGKRYQNGQRR